MFIRTAYRSLHIDAGNSLRDMGITFIEFPTIEVFAFGKRQLLVPDYLLSQHNAVISCRSIEHRMCIESKPEIRDVYERRLIELRLILQQSDRKLGLIDPIPDNQLLAVREFTYLSIEDCVYFNNWL